MIRPWFKWGLIIVLGLALIHITVFFWGAADSEEERSILATTTSTENSGLLARLLPPFEAESNYRVDVVAVGTGKALEMGRNGDADVLLVHAKEAEKEFINQGYGKQRTEIMYNDFVLLGPASDPAEITASSDVLAALEAIAQAEASFISRGDDSGTNKKELNLWSAAGLSPVGSWYQETGQGMGETLTIATEKRGYVLSDRATYLNYRDQIDLEILVDGGEKLYNPYGVILVSPEQHPGVNLTGAKELVEYLTSVQAQEIIRNYDLEGQQLFKVID